MSGTALKTRLKFKKSALKEWNALDSKIRETFRKKLKKRAESLAALTPIKHKLSGVEKCYKIKLRMDGFRLVYHVLESDDGEVDVVITVITVDRREDVYEALKSKLVKD
ncbi:type II toxin-antitoxin system RelE family toxin [Serratia symbiotica]|uniref:Type II toxin-antitoxin system RelE/ParE family toxin n=1 Tax=Serratia symbiotica TaxID=138074 RepID=A0A068YZ97_9GAMM|nr:type II toxin-antitoxin system RelE/ParE family toxin [Serratia symbiotica]QLH61943.1 type II toxin-antitoxin system RelE/ParE family toxin [Serratia symbiotica]CDS56928.1 putative RelE-like toxin protein [Serratia symbiotica]